MENKNGKYENDTIDKQNDRILQQVFIWVQSGIRPTIDENSTLIRKGQTLQARFDELAIVDNKLCLILTVGDKSSEKIIPPTNIRKEIIDNYYSGVGGGNLSFEKKYLKIKDRLNWPNMKEEIKIKCYSCVRCGARKGAQHNLCAALVSTVAGFPFERIAMDIVGPLPKTPRNNRYMLVEIDYYTRQPEAYAIENQEAHSVAINLISEFFARFGAPYIVYTDHGANFESSFIKELCNHYDIKKTRTTFYYSPPDGFVERHNKTLLDTIALIARDASENWDIRIGPALMAVRSAAQSATGYCPHFL